MATTSEIQVTEAYIGLLGRAPDPAGLAYWAAELDAAIAAGEDPAVALKKLTNDITLNDEWLVDGDGSIDVTGGTDAQNLANAETVVTNMYKRLFERDSVTQAELDYWAPKLVSGEFTSSEMAVALIQGAGATDGDVLGYKQQAATYYVESITQDQFTKSEAKSSVDSVDGPKTLSDSKTATDYVASGVGETTALKAGADTVTMTAGSDTVTGVVGTGETFDTTDNITDASTTDSDTLTITGDDEFDFGTVVKVENINVHIGKQLGGGFTVDADKAVGGTIDFTVDDKVTIANVEVTGETSLTVNNLASSLTTHNVTTLVTDFDDDAVTITTDADATSVTATLIDNGATSIVLGNETATTLNISGSTATNDVASVTASGTVTMDVSSVGTNDVEYLTLASGSNDVTYKISGVTTGGAMKYTTDGDNGVTLSGAAAAFSGAKFVMGADTALDITTAGDLDLTAQGVFADGIDLSVAMDADTVTLQSGNTLTISATQVANDTLTLVSANDTKADSLDITLSNSAGELETTNFETVTIATGDKAKTIDIVDMDDNGANVSIIGTGNITITNDTDAGTLTVSGNDVTFSAGGVTSTVGKVDIDAIDSATVTAGGITANDGLTIDADDFHVTGTIAVTNGDAALNASNNSDVDAVTVSAGSLDITAKALAVGGNVAAQNDIDITVTGAITAGTSTIKNTGAGTSNSIDINTTNIVSVGAIGDSKTRDITITASNDASTSHLDGNVTSTSSITLDDGKFDPTGVTLQTESLIISGDTDVIGTAAVKAESITITSTNDVKFADVKELNDGEGLVVSAATAGGDITMIIDNDGSSGRINVVTGSGNDTITVGENTVTTVETNGGKDTVNILDAAAGSVINTGAGDDTIDDDEMAAITVVGGEGNDTYTPVAGTKSSVDLGAGDGDKVVLGGLTLSSTGTFKNYEILDISGGAASMSTAQFNADNTFELTGANTLTVTGGGTTAVTIDASNLEFDVAAIGNLNITGSTKADTITGSSAVDKLFGGAGDDVIIGGGSNDVIDGEAGNDTMTGGTGIDHFDIDVTDGGTDTITDFVSGTDVIDIDGYTNDYVIGNHNDVAAVTGAVTLAANTGVNEITGTLRAAITDFSNGTQVLAAISDTSVSAAAVDDIVLTVIYSGGNAYIYEMNDADSSTTIEAGEVTLIATLEGVTDVNSGDFI